MSSFENFKNSCPGLQNPSEAQRKEHEKYEFALHEVYAVDVLISSGEGQVENFWLTKSSVNSSPYVTVVLTYICCQGREKDAKITIYKKTEDT